MTQLVLLEVNEVPNVVLDAYARRSPFMARFLADSDRFETVAADRVQLDPWIAWPSLHRGVNDETHGILHLGQVPKDDARHPPIWRLLADAGLRVGVYGSLHSCLEEDISRYAFFVPDVFSHHERVKPDSLAKFQAFNLAMTRASGRNANDKLAKGGAASILDLAMRRRVRTGTLARLAAQLVSERFDRRRLSRRRNAQTDLHADVFCALFEAERPDFATFYTNNVAAAMHRFWSASIPETSVNEGRLERAWLDAYADEVFVALGSVERMIRRLLRGPTGDNLRIILASAIGQEEIPAENHRQFLTITDPVRLVKRLFEHEAAPPFELRPTMVPDFTIRFADPAAVDAATAKLAGLSIGGFASIETHVRMHSKRIVQAGGRFDHIEHNYGVGEHFKHAVTYCRSDAHTLHISIQIDDYEGDDVAFLGNQSLPFAELGLGVVSHDEGVNCTAQHCARGALVIHGRGRHSEAPSEVSALDVAPSILSHFGAPKPAYMPGLAAIAFR